MPPSFRFHSPDDGNQLAVVHLRDGSDLVLALHHPRGEDLIGEMVAVLAHQFNKVLNREVDIRVANQLTARAKNKVSWNGGGKAQARKKIN